MFRAMADAGWSRRSRRSWRRCEHVGPTVVRATFSPTVALLLLLVASLLPDHIVLFCVGATRCCRAHATWLLLAGAGACRSRTAPSWSTWPRPARSTCSCSSARLECRLGCTPSEPCCTRRCGVLGLRSWPACSTCTCGERPPQDFLLVCGSSALAPSCWNERRRQMSCAAAAVPLRRVARARDFSASQLACT